MITPRLANAIDYQMELETSYRTAQAAFSEEDAQTQHRLNLLLHRMCRRWYQITKNIREVENNTITDLYEYKLSKKG